jgi:hypothetical protein
MQIRISRKELRLGAVTVVDPVVHYGARKIVCDSNLDGRLARLVPDRWGNAPLEAWRPFVALAVAKGAL